MSNRANEFLSLRFVLVSFIWISPLFLSLHFCEALLGSRPKTIRHAFALALAYSLLLIPFTTLRRKKVLEQRGWLASLWLRMRCGLLAGMSFGALFLAPLAIFIPVLRMLVQERPLGEWALWQHLLLYGCYFVCFAITGVGGGIINGLASLVCVGYRYVAKKKGD